MVYLPTFTINKNQPNVGKYTIHTDLVGMDDVFKDNDKDMQTSGPFYAGKSARWDLVIKDQHGKQNKLVPSPRFLWGCEFWKKTFKI